MRMCFVFVTRQPTPGIAVNADIEININKNVDI